MKFIRILLLLILVFTGFSGGFLFYIKYEVLSLEKNLYCLNEKINTTKETLTALEAEWSYLTHPKRIERLSSTHLGLEPIKQEQILSLKIEKDKITPFHITR